MKHNQATVSRIPRRLGAALIIGCALCAWQTASVPAQAISSTRYHGGSGDGWDMKQISPPCYQGGAEDGGTLSAGSASNAVMGDVCFYSSELHILGQIPGTVYAGTPFSWGAEETPLSVEVLDNKGRRYSNTVFTVSLTLKNGGGTLGGTTNAATVNGVAAFQNAGLFLSSSGTGFVIEAQAESLGSAESGAFSVQDLPSAPDVPTGLSATDGTYTNKVRVTWNTASGATGYQIWRYTNSTSASASQIGAPTSSPYDDTSATASTVYYYWLKATNIGGASAFSAWNSGWKAPVVTAPAAPTGVAATDGDYTNKVRVTWTAADGATGYQIWRNTTDSSAGASSIGTTDSTAYDDTDTPAETTYYYWVKATNTAGASGFSASDTGWRATPIVAPAAPEGVSASDGAYTNRVQITWNLVSGATGYQVWRNTVNMSSRASLLGTAASATYDDRDATGNVMYYYWVKATNSVGASGFSASDTGYGKPAATAPSAPSGVSASDGTYTNKIVITWNAADGATNYSVWRNTSDNSSAAALLASTAERSCVDTTAVEAGVRVYYWVVARNSLGDSPFSQSDSGYRGVPGTADLALRGLLFQPNMLTTNAHPGLIMLMAQNNGPEPLANSTATFEFFLSRNLEFGDSDDQAIGAYQVGINANAGASASVIVSGAGLTGVTIPADAVGAYYVFARMSTLLTDPVASNNVVMRAGAIMVGGNEQPVAGDFDGDSKADPALYQESTGNWYVKPSASGYVLTTLNGFGHTGYLPILADYDGDGKTDLAAFDVATGTLYVKLSGSAYAQVSYSFGASGYGCRLLAADYDGGGDSDLALYQEANYSWTVLLAENGSLATLEFGAGGCQPVAGDYDADGKADPALYREATGEWFIRLSGSAYSLVGTTLGGAGYQPVAGDYDGDGKADLMVYKEATGAWQAMLSGSGYTQVSVADFGGLDYIPVAGDYDGDGKADLVLYDQARATWLFKLSASDYGLLTSPF